MMVFEFLGPQFGNRWTLITRLQFALAALLIACFHSLLPAQQLPKLIVPAADAPRDAAGTPLPPDTVRRLGSGLFRWRDQIGSQLIGFSPSGETLYLHSSDFTALDARSGQVRWTYEHGAQHLEVNTENPEGVRIQICDGRHDGDFFLLEHNTGRELRRGHEARRQLKLPETGVPLPSVIGSRMIVPVVSEEQQRRQRNPPEPLFGNLYLLWDVDQGREVLKLGEYESQVMYAFSPDQKQFIFDVAGRACKLMDADTGKLNHEIPLGWGESDHRTYSPVWSHDSTKVYVWRKDAKEFELVEVTAATGNVRSLARLAVGYCSMPVASPNGRYLAYLFYDKKELPVWKVIELSDGSELRTVDVRPEMPRVTFSPDSKSLWLQSDVGLARYDLAEGRLATPRCDPFSPVTALSFSHDGRQVFAVAGAELITWDVATGNECAPRKEFAFARRTGAQCRSIDASGEHSVWWDGSNICHALREKETAKFHSGGRAGTNHVISANGERIVYDDYWGELKLADFRTGKEIFELYPKPKPRPSYTMALAPDNRTLALVRSVRQSFAPPSPGEIEFWDLNERKRVSVLKLEVSSFMKLRFSPDSRQLYVWQEGACSTWDVATQKLVGQRKRKQFENDYLYDADGQHVFEYVNVATGGYEIQRQSVTDDTVAASWRWTRQFPLAMALSPAENLLAIASQDGPVVLLDLATKEKEK